MGRRFTKEDFNKRPDFLSVAEIIDTQADGTERQLFGFTDNHGFFYTKERVMDIIVKAMEFYNQPDTEEFIIKENKKARLRSSFSPFAETEDGKFLFPKNPARKKPFKPHTKWTTKCGWCKTKITEPEHGSYYLINEQQFDIFEHACSEACSDLLWKEAAINWINENKMKELFDLEANFIRN